MRTRDETLTVIALAGEVDMYLAPELMERTRSAIENGARGLLFDFSRATLIDSTTLGSLVSAHKQMQARGGTIGVVCPDPLMARIFSITGLDRKFPVRDSVAELMPILGSAELVLSCG